MKLFLCVLFGGSLAACTSNGDAGMFTDGGTLGTGGENGGTGAAPASGTGGVSAGGQGGNTSSGGGSSGSSAGAGTGFGNGGASGTANGAGGSSATGGRGNGGRASSGGMSSGGTSDGSASGGSANSGGTGGSSANGGAGTGGAAGGIWKPAPGTSWQWQLSGKLDSSFDVKAYDIDLFDHTAAEIQGLHDQGRKVICYFDTAYEPGRPDSAMLAPYKGNPVDGWPGEFWVDLRQPAVLDVMEARIQMASDKHCDGIEADDVDQLSNDPGFPFTDADQEAFIRGMANAAHALGISYGLKNDLDEISALLDVSDFAINEECFQYDECDTLAPFIKAGKAVFQVEYTDGDLAQKGATICPKSIPLDFDTLIKHLALDAPRYSCR